MAQIDYTAPEPTDWVTMVHPEIDGEAEVTREALEQVYAEKGWVIKTPDEASKAPDQVPVTLEDALAMGVDPAEVIQTETAPSTEAVVGEENLADAPEETKSRSKTTKE